LSPAAGEQVPAHAAWYDDWHAVALVVVFATAGLALIVFVRRELRRGGSPRA